MPCSVMRADLAFCKRAIAKSVITGVLVSRKRMLSGFMSR